MTRTFTQTEVDELVQSRLARAKRSHREELATATADADERAAAAEARASAAEHELALIRAARDAGAFDPTDAPRLAADLAGEPVAVVAHLRRRHPALFRPHPTTQEN